MGWQAGFRRHAAQVSGALLLAACSVASAAATASEPAAAGPRWTGSWEAAMAAAVDDGCADCTIRDVVHLSAGGTSLRVRLSNAFGTGPLVVGHTTVARPAVPGGAGVAPGTLRQVTFHGRPAVSVPAGADAASDPVPLAVAAGGDLLVTTYTPGRATPMTYHLIALQRAYLTRGADAADAVEAGAFSGVSTLRHLVSGVDVAGGPGAVVTLGDSITDGYRSTAGANRRWPDVLAERLRSEPPYRRFGVLNAGIGGNRVLRDRGRHGQSALRRLDRDVLSRAGVRTVIVLEGINDIQQRPHELDPDKITAGLAAIARRAHARGLRVVGGTLTPFGGCPCYSPREEQTPGDEGYAAMGNAVDPSAL